MKKDNNIKYELQVDNFIKLKDYIDIINKFEVYLYRLQYEAEYIEDKYNTLFEIGIYNVVPDKHETDIINEFCRLEKLYSAFKKFLPLKLEVTSPVMDIYVGDGEGVGRKEYYLTLHGTNKKIGTIYVNYNERDTDINLYGNIGYQIEKEYRGNEYSLKALELLLDKLIDNGMDTAHIFVLKNNKASRTIAEKFGGVDVSIEDDGKCRYVVDLKEKKKKQIEDIMNEKILEK